MSRSLLKLISDSTTQKKAKSRKSRLRFSIYAISRALQLLEEFARGARDINPARDVAFAIFNAFDDACGLAALGTIRALGGIHDLFAVGCFCDLGAYCHI
jgi:hypothetical protein